MTEATSNETMPLSEIFLRHLALLKAKLFYWTVTVAGFFAGLTLLVAIGGEKTNPYHVEPWAFVIILAGLSVVLGLTMWLANETKHKAKENLPPIPSALTPTDLTEVQSTLNSNKIYRKLQRLDLSRTITTFLGITIGFFLAQDMWGATTLLPNQLVIIQTTISGVLIITGIILHIISLSIQKRNFQAKHENPVPDTEATEDAQPHT